MDRVVLASALILAACSGGMPGAEPEPEPDVPEACKNIHVDRLAGDWIAFAGKSADPKTRMRIVEPSSVGGAYEAWFVGGFFTKRRLMGEKREADVRFTEVPSGKRAERVKKGEEDRVRVYVKPRLSKCALEVFVGSVDEDDKEKIPPRGTEFLVFPKSSAVFSFRPADRELFLADAAKDKKVADKQLEELGHAKPDAEFGSVPVGLFTLAEADGSADCSYTMDLFFDDQLIDGGRDVAAGEVADGHRHWFHEWQAPYSGNHHFEMHRYRKCGSEDRQLLDVAAIEAVLQ